MNIENLTPHVITIHTTAGEIVVCPSKYWGVMRVQQKMLQVGMLGGCGLYKASYGELELVGGCDKPLVELMAHAADMGGEGKIIVSGQCLDAIREQYSQFAEWFASPGELVRDDKGQPIGCKGLRVL